MQQVPPAMVPVTELALPCRLNQASLSMARKVAMMSFQPIAGRRRQYSRKAGSKWEYSPLEANPNGGYHVEQDL
jgi:hypothetical protein